MNLEIAAFYLGKWYYPKSFLYNDEDLLPRITFESSDGTITTPFFYSYTGVKDINNTKIYDRYIVSTVINGKEYKGSVEMLEGCWTIVFHAKYRVGSKYFKHGYLKDFKVKSLGPGMYTEV